MYTVKYKIFRYTVCMIGIMLTSLSAAIFYLVQLGSDPYQVMVSGVANIIGVSYGMTIMIVNISLSICMILFARKYVKIALFLVTFCSGFLVDRYINLLQSFIHKELPMFQRIIIGMIGCFIMVIGIFLYLTPELGASPTEAIGLVIAEFVHKPYGHIRLILDIFFTLIGTVMGGNLGIVTVIAVLMTGPLVLGLETLWKEKLVKLMKLR